MAEKRQLKAISKKNLFALFVDAIKPDSGTVQDESEVIAVARVIFGLTEILWEKMEPVSDDRQA